MTYLPKISSYNSEQFKSTINQTPEPRKTPYNSQSLSTNNSRDNGEMNGSKYSTKFNDTSLVKSPAVLESRLTEMESKIFLLQESNSILLNRLNQSERKTDLQIQDLLMKSNDEKTNRYKSEKMLDILTNQNNLNTKDINSKINTIQETLQREGNYKNQQRERDIEIYKGIIAKLSEKVSEIVKTEIEERFKADLTNRESNLQIKNYLENQISYLKRDFDKYIEQNQAELQKMSIECSERTHNVSKYIDQQIQENNFGNGSNDLLKNFVNKLTDQVKFNLVSQNNKNIAFENKLNKFSETIGNYTNDFEKRIKAVEERLIEKLSTIKLYTEMNITKIHKDVYLKLSEFSNKVDNNIEFLASDLIDTKKKASHNFEVILKDNKEKFKTITEDLNNITNRIYQYENLIKDHDSQNATIQEKFEQMMNMCYSNTEIAIINERIISEVQNKIFEEHLKKISDDINDKEKKLNEIINQNQILNNDNSNNLLNEIKETNSRIEELQEINENAHEDIKNKIKDNEIKSIVNELICKLEGEETDIRIKEINTKINVLGVQAENTLADIRVIENTIKEQKDNINENKSMLDNYNNNFGDHITKYKQLENKFNDYEKETAVKTIIDNLITETEIEELKKLNNINRNSIESMQKIVLIANNDTKADFNNKMRLMEINSVMECILNKTEFDNVYKHLNLLKQMESTRPEPVSAPINVEAYDNKFNNLLEKIKLDNQSTWEKFTQMEQEFFEPEYIKKVIGNIPPIVLPKTEVVKNILEMSYEDYNYPVPFDAALVSKLITINRLDKNGNLNDEYVKEEDNNKSVKDDDKSKKSKSNKGDGNSKLSKSIKNDENSKKSKTNKDDENSKKSKSNKDDANSKLTKSIKNDEISKKSKSILDDDISNINKSMKNSEKSKNSKSVKNIENSKNSKSLKDDNPVINENNEL